MDDIKPFIINKDIFNFLKTYGWSQVPRNRYVSLIFDLALVKDVVPPKDAPADIPPYVILLAIQVINDNGFQPIGNIFLYDSTPAWKVSDCIKAYIQDLQKCEFLVMSTVCPPSEFFRSVVENLVEIEKLSKKTDAHVYSVGDVNNIVHIYDAPSMLKEVRNHFIKSRVKFRQFGHQFTADYKEIETLLKSSPNESLKEVYKMYDCMDNTKYATKLFSMSMYHELREAIVAGKLEDTGTADLCSFFDILFDSFNGDRNYNKLNRMPVSSSSPHDRVWKTSISVLKSMKFLNTGEDSTKRSDTVRNKIRSSDKLYTKIKENKTKIDQSKHNGVKTTDDSNSNEKIASMTLTSEAHLNDSLTSDVQYINNILNTNHSINNDDPIVALDILNDTAYLDHILEDFTKNVEEIVSMETSIGDVISSQISHLESELCNTLNTYTNSQNDVVKMLNEYKTKNATSESEVDVTNQVQAQVEEFSDNAICDAITTNEEDKFKNINSNTIIKGDCDKAAPQKDEQLNVDSNAGHEILINKNCKSEDADNDENEFKIINTTTPCLIKGGCKEVASQNSGDNAGHVDVTVNECEKSSAVISQKVENECVLKPINDINKLLKLVDNLEEKLTRSRKISFTINSTSDGRNNNSNPSMNSLDGNSIISENKKVTSKKENIEPKNGDKNKLQESSVKPCSHRGSTKKRTKRRRSQNAQGIQKLENDAASDQPEVSEPDLKEKVPETLSNLVEQLRVTGLMTKLNTTFDALEDENDVKVPEKDNNTIVSPIKTNQCLTTTTTPCEYDKTKGVIGNNSEKAISTNNEVSSIPQYVQFIPVRKCSTENKDGTKECNALEHVSLEKITAQIKKIYPDIRVIASNKTLSKNVCDNMEQATSTNKNPKRPFVLDAWIISINGMREIYNNLRNKRFERMNTGDFNVDFIHYMLDTLKQVNGIATEQGSVECNIRYFLNRDLIDDAFLPGASLTLK